MCGRNVSLLSRVTPSVLTVSESDSAVPAVVSGDETLLASRPGRLHSTFDGSARVSITESQSLTVCMSDGFLLIVRHVLGFSIW